MDDKAGHRDGDLVTMTHITTTEGELRQAIQAGLNRRTTERRATSVRYDPERDAIEIELTGGAAIRVPRRIIEELSAVPLPGTASNWTASTSPSACTACWPPS